MKKLIVATTVLLLPLFGHPGQTDHVAQLAILFPETEEGVTVNDLPRVTREWLQDKRDNLRSAFLRSNFGELVEGQGCSFISRVLYDGDELRKGDVSGDGVEDLLYVGPAICREGDATVIWYGKESKRGRWIVDRTRIMESEVLRIRPGSSPGLAGIKPGCCGHPTTQYYSHYLDRKVRPLKKNREDVDKQMVFPETRLAERSSVILDRRELVLRSSPELLDAYNKDKSQWVAHAVFGNILRKYLEGATAEILAQTEDEDGTLWSFVRIDRSDWHLSHHTAVKTDVGWTDDVALPGCSTKAPWSAREKKESPNLTRTVTHYTMKRDVGPNIWRDLESCLLITDADTSWWVPRHPDSRFERFEFMNDSRLFVTVGWGGGTLTFLLDLDSRDLRSLGGGGNAAQLHEGPDADLVLVKGDKRYFVGGGYYRVNLLVNVDGELVEFVSPGGAGPCVKVVDILQESESKAKLRQSLDECVVVGID